MVETLSIIYLGYMFISIYFLTFYLTLFFRNKKDFFESPKPVPGYKISVLVPSFNEEETIKDTIDAIFASTYPLLEVIILNDGSVDNTKKVVEKLMKKYPSLKLVNKKNSGKADSLNQGIKLAKGNLIAVVDADSYPSRDSFEKMVGFFEEKDVGVATSFIVPRNSNNLLEKLQTIEYSVIAFTRKLLGYVDAIYVTPGPLALYRKSALIEIGGFDPTNMTEDIEATWHLTKLGYKRKMTLLGKVSTTVPSKSKEWYTQRRRWSMGGLQCVMKYKKEFFKRGMLGQFILPYFALQWCMGVFGMGLFLYLITQRFLDSYLFLSYSVGIGSPVLTSQALNITPSFLNYLGIVVFFFGAFFTFLILYIMKEGVLKKQNIFKIFLYFFIYLPVYPFISVLALYKYLRGNRQWR